MRRHKIIIATVYIGQAVIIKTCRLQETTRQYRVCPPRKVDAFDTPLFIYQLGFTIHVLAKCSYAYCCRTFST